MEWDHYSKTKGRYTVQFATERHVITSERGIVVDDVEDRAITDASSEEGGTCLYGYRKEREPDAPSTLGRGCTLRAAMTLANVLADGGAVEKDGVRMWVRSGRHRLVAPLPEVKAPRVPLATEQAASRV